MIATLAIPVLVLVIGIAIILLIRKKYPELNQQNCEENNDYRKSTDPSELFVDGAPNVANPIQRDIFYNNH